VRRDIVFENLQPGSSTTPCLFAPYRRATVSLQVLKFGNPQWERFLLVLSPSAAGEKLEDKEEGYIMDDAQHSRPVA
jgi:hypothetical protein